MRCVHKKGKQCILSLKKDDLINSKLLRGLNKAGLDADRYCPFLSGTIFDLMGYPNTKSWEMTYITIFPYQPANATTMSLSPSPTIAEENP